MEMGLQSDQEAGRLPGNNISAPLFTTQQTAPGWLGVPLPATSKAKTEGPSLAESSLIGIMFTLVTASTCFATIGTMIR